MFCSKCGAKAADDAKFCEKCGARLDALPQSQAAPAPVRPQKALPPQQAGGRSALPVVRPTTRPAPVQPPRQAGPAAAKPRRRLPVVWIAAAAILVCLLATGLAFAATKVSKPVQPYVLYMDGSYQLFTDPSDPEFIELDDLLDYPDQSYCVQFSANGEYIYFFDGTADGSYVLKCVEWKKLKKGSSKNDRYVKVVAEDVRLEGIRLFDDGTACFRNEDRDLLYYDGEETDRIMQEVTTYWGDSAGHIVYCVETGEDEYAFYGMTAGKPDTKKKILSDVANWFSGASTVEWRARNSSVDGFVLFQTIGGSAQRAYLCSYDSDEPTLLGEVEDRFQLGRQLDEKDALFFAVENGKGFDLHDYVKGNVSELDSWGVIDMMEWTIFEGQPTVTNLSIVQDGKLEQKAEDVVFYESLSDQVVRYMSQSDLGALDYTNYNSLEDLGQITRDWLAESFRLLVKYPDGVETLTLSQAATELMADETIYDMAATSDYMYLQTWNTLYAAPIKNGQVGAFTPVAESTGITVRDDICFYTENDRTPENEAILREIADVYVCDGDEGVLLATGAYALYVDEEGNQIRGQEDGAWVVDANGKETWLGEQIIDFCDLGDGKYVYLTGDSNTCEVFYYNGKEREKIAEDADGRLWHENLDAGAKFTLRF